MTQTTAATGTTEPRETPEDGYAMHIGVHGKGVEQVEEARRVLEARKEGRP